MELFSKTAAPTGPSRRPDPGTAVPSDDDRTFVKSLMVRCVEPDKIAGWIAPPARGVNKEDPAEYEYVRFNK